MGTTGTDARSGSDRVEEWKQLVLDHRREQERRLGITIDGGVRLRPDAVRQAMSGDPASALAAVRELRAAVDVLEARAVRRARLLGWSWGKIGRVAGRSKQAVHRRYGEQRAA